MGLIIGIGNTTPKNPYSQWYGVKIAKGAVASESLRCTRINGEGASELHTSLPLQNAMKRCLLNDDGTVNYYLHYADSTKKSSGAAAILDGSDGQIMVEIPDTWIRFEEDDEFCYVMMSEHELPGFKLWGKKYVSAVEATLDKTTNKLCSVINWDANHTGGNGTAVIGSANMLGRPRTNLSLDNYRNYAANRGAGWYCNTYSVQKHLYWLMVVEYANLNSQTNLGNGVSTLADAKWAAYNSYNPVVPCGVTIMGYSDNDDATTPATLSANNLGNNSGEAAYTLKAGTYDTADTIVYVNSYRGVENPFAHIWKWTDGILMQAGAERSDIYICDDPAHYASSINEHYKLKGYAARESGYLKSIMFGEDGDIMPTAIGASSSTYFGDYFYTNAATSQGLRGVFFGGYAASGASCGFLYSHTAGAPSNAAANLGSRLCFIP